MGGIITGKLPAKMRFVVRRLEHVLPEYSAVSNPGCPAPRNHTGLRGCMTDVAMLDSIIAIFRKCGIWNSFDGTRSQTSKKSTHASIFPTLKPLKQGQRIDDCRR